MQYSNVPLGNFNRSIKKAQAFLSIYTVLDNLEKGKYNAVIKELTELGKDLQNSYLPPEMQNELKRKIKNDKRLKEKLEKKALNFIYFFKEHELGVKSFFEAYTLAKEEILLEQSLVLTISAFEIFTKDSAIYLVNRNPDTHKRFQSEINNKLTYPALKLNRYNFTNSIGNLLWDEQTFFNLRTISTTFSNILSINEDKIFPNGQCKNKIHKYIELRHLIVHRNSIVDRRLFEQTGIKKRLGKRYPLTKMEVEEAIRVITGLLHHVIAV
jgi:hypothetical protein